MITDSYRNSALCTYAPIASKHVVLLETKKSTQHNLKATDCNFYLRKVSIIC